MAKHHDTTHPDYLKAFMYTERKMRATPADHQVDIQARSVLAYDVLKLHTEIPFEACATSARRGDLNHKLDLALRRVAFSSTEQPFRS